MLSIELERGKKERKKKRKKPTHPHVKDTSGIRNGLGVGLRVSAAAPHVKANTNDIQTQLTCTLQQQPAVLQRGPELNAQATHSLRIVRGNAQNQPDDGKADKLDTEIQGDKRRD